MGLLDLQRAVTGEGQGLGPMASLGGMGGGMGGGVAAPAAVAPAYRPKASFSGQRPEISQFGYGYQRAVNGKDAADSMVARKMDPYLGKVTAYMARELLEGRPADRPLGMAEIVGLVQHVDPALMQNKKLMGGLKLWAGEWNKEVQARLERQAKRATNLYNSGKDLGAVYGAEDRALMGQHGYLVRGPGQGMASAPGLMGMGQGGGGGLMGGSFSGDMPATSKPKSTARSTAFPGGVFPRPGQREAEKIRDTTPAEVARAGASARVTQNEQTRGHAARRRHDQVNPLGKYVNRTNPGTGDKSQVWSGGAQEVDQGREPYSAQDQYAQVLAKFLELGEAGLSPEEMTLLRTRMAEDKGNLMSKLDALLNPGGSGQAAPNPATNQAPLAGAPTTPAKGVPAGDGLKVGDLVLYKGQRVRITNIHGDGTFDYEMTN